MTRADLKKAAKSQIKGKIFKLFVMVLIIFAISFVLALIPLVGTIASSVLSMIFSLSLCMVYLKIANNQDIEIGDVFSGFKIPAKAFWINLRVAIQTFLWSCLFLIPGIIKTYSYALSQYILADNPDMSVGDAIKESRRLMDGHKFELFVLQLSFILWDMLGSITLGIGFIYVIPYQSATVANFYKAIKAEKSGTDVVQTTSTDTSEPEPIVAE